MFNRLKTTLKVLWPLGIAIFKAVKPQYAIPADIGDKIVRDAVKRIEDEQPAIPRN